MKTTYKHSNDNDDRNNDQNNDVDRNDDNGENSFWSMWSWSRGPAAFDLQTKIPEDAHQISKEKV